MDTVSPINANGLVELLLGLIFVVFLIFALAWAFKRFGNGGLGMSGLIKVIAAMSLGNRDRIALISVGDKQLLIGISPGRISTLHVLEEPIDLLNDKDGESFSGDFKHELANKIQSLLTGEKA